METMFTQLNAKGDILQAILDSLGKPAEPIASQTLSAAELCALIAQHSSPATFCQNNARSGRYTVHQLASG
jgi:hypothetical protein